MSFTLSDTTDKNDCSKDFRRVAIFGCCFAGRKRSEHSMELKDDDSDKFPDFLTKRWHSGRGLSCSPVKFLSPKKASRGKPSLPSRSSLSVAKVKPQIWANRRPKSRSLTPKKKMRSAAPNYKPSFVRGLDCETKSFAHQAKVSRLKCDDCKLQQNVPEDEIACWERSKFMPPLAGLREANSLSSLSTEFYDDRSPVFASGLSSTPSYIKQKGGLERIGSFDSDNQYGGEEGAKPVCSFSSTTKSIFRKPSEGQSWAEDKRPQWSLRSYEGVPEIELLSSPLQKRVRAFSETVQPKRAQVLSEALALMDEIGKDKSSSSELITMEGERDKPRRGRSM